MWKINPKRESLVKREIKRCFWVYLVIASHAVVLGDSDFTSPPQTSHFVGRCNKSHLKTTAWEVNVVSTIRKSDESVSCYFETICDPLSCWKLYQLCYIQRHVVLFFFFFWATTWAFLDKKIIKATLIFCTDGGWENKRKPFSGYITELMVPI